MLTGYAPNLSEIHPGSQLQELRLTPLRSQVFMFSAITWNRHRIHFDKDQAIAEGFPDVAVQRGLIGNYMARLLTDWAGAGGRLGRLHWKVTRSAFPEEELCCQGIVTEVATVDNATTVSCALRVMNPRGEQVADGEGRVHFLPETIRERSADDR